MAQSEGVLIGARFVQGVGGALDLCGGAGDARHDVPRAARAGEGDRRLRLRRLGRRLDRPASRRHPDRRDQLALDLLHQRPDRHRHRAAGAAPRRAAPRDRAGSGRRPARRRDPRHRPDDRGVLDPPGQRAGLDVGPDARPRPRLGRPRRHVRDAPGADREPADAAAPVPLAQRRRSQHRDGAAGRGDVRDVLPRRPLHAADPRLRPAPGRPRLPALDDRHGHDVAALLGAPEHALRPARRR